MSRRRNGSHGPAARPAGAEAALPKPLKRPSQARSRFTVQAVYDAFCKIWQRDGWERLTTRSVALEAGVSIGALYEYFPSKEALLSGYVRHGIDGLLARLEQDVVLATGLDAAARLERLVRLTCSGRQAGTPYFDRDMLMLESLVAERKHHRRVYEELVQVWQRALTAGPDAPPVAADTVHALVAAAWGGRRYLLLVDASEAEEEGWVQEMLKMCRERLR